MNKPAYLSSVHFYNIERIFDKGPLATGYLVVADVLDIPFALWERDNGDLSLSLPRTPNPKFKKTGSSRRYFNEVRLRPWARASLVSYVLSELQDRRFPSDVDPEKVEVKQRFDTYVEKPPVGAVSSLSTWSEDSHATEMVLNSTENWGPSIFDGCPGDDRDDRFI